MINRKVKIIIYILIAAAIVFFLKNKFAGSQIQTVNFKSADVYFDTTSIKSKAGETLLFKVQNTGKHTFVIDELNFKKELPEGNSEFTLKVDKKGIYTYYCDESGHRQAGQFGTLFVE